MAFAVIPFCWIVKFSGITRFLYQFWKISPKYWGRKEKDHNILWSKWYSRRESNPQRPLRRGLLYPFNYGSIFYIKCIPADSRRVSAETPKGVPSAGRRTLSRSRANRDRPSKADAIPFSDSRIFLFCFKFLGARDRYQPKPRSGPPRYMQKEQAKCLFFLLGARDGNRTRGNQLGKLTPYH